MGYISKTFKIQIYKYISVHIVQKYVKVIIALPIALSCILIQVVHVPPMEGETVGGRCEARERETHSSQEWNRVLLYFNLHFDIMYLL